MEFERVYLYPGDLFVGESPKELSTVLGSCVSVCMWDRMRRYGGMNHYLLPRSTSGQAASPRYGDVAIQQMIVRFLRYGLQVKELEAIIVGGGSPVAALRKTGGIGEQNVRLARMALKKYRVRIVGENVGGNMGRRLRFQSGANLIRIQALDKTRATDWLDEFGNPVAAQAPPWPGPERRRPAGASAPLERRRLHAGP